MFSELGKETVWQDLAEEFPRPVLPPLVRLQGFSAEQTLLPLLSLGKFTRNFVSP